MHGSTRTIRCAEGFEPLEALPGGAVTELQSRRTVLRGLDVDGQSACLKSYKLNTCV